MNLERAMNPGGSLRPVQDARSHALAAASLWGAAGLMLFVAALLISRRLCGALSEPLGPAALLAVAMLAVGPAACLRLVLKRFPWQVCGAGVSPADAAGTAASQKRGVALGWVLRILPSVSLVLLGVAISPGGPWLGLVAFWLAVAAEEGWAWWPRLRPSASVAVIPAHEMAEGDLAKNWGQELADELPPDEVLQQVTRLQAADGGDELTAWLRVPLAPGQRTADAHIAFCPPFAATPEVELEQTDGPDARVKVAQVLPYGVRLDLKLASACTTSESVLLRVYARAGQAVPDTLCGEGEAPADLPSR